MFFSHLGGLKLRGKRRKKGEGKDSGGRGEGGGKKGS